MEPDQPAEPLAVDLDDGDRGESARRRVRQPGHWTFPSSDRDAFAHPGTRFFGEASVRVQVDDELLAARADKLANQLVALPAQALSSTKRLVWSGLGAPVEARLAEEARTVSDLSGTADALEGLRAVIERRAPRFTGR